MNISYLLLYVYVCIIYLYHFFADPQGYRKRAGEWKKAIRDRETKHNKTSLSLSAPLSLSPPVSLSPSPAPFPSASALLWMR